MSLSSQAVDRLFERLHATYARDFLAQYEGLDILAVKSSWAHELAGFANDLGAIAWALEHLPERKTPPNVLEFRALCRKAPEKEAPPRVEDSRAGKARIAEELAKLGPIAKSLRASNFYGKDWAVRLISRHDSGDARPRACIVMARAALAERSILTGGEE